MRNQYPGEVGYNPGSQMIQIAGISVLDPLDHMAKDLMGIRNYIRYMDDAVAILPTREEAERATTAAERISGTLRLLQSMLGLPKPPMRLEAYDISNIAGTDIVASMVVFVDGKPKKSDYKRFKLENMDGQDDYASMHQVLLRRLTHYVQQDAGFSEHPDVLLIDGGVEHTKVAEADHM